MRHRIDPLRRSGSASPVAGADPPPAAVRLRSPAGRWIVFACILGSGLAGIDSTVVNVALPAIGRSLHVGFSDLQWTVTAYSVTLAALILLGGSLGDRFGRRRVFTIGVVAFSAASVLCAVAPGIWFLLIARAIQGAGAALLTPASLAILEATFAAGDRGPAIGRWSSLSGTASAIAPFVGGWLLAAGDWRWVFLINPPLGVLVALIAWRHIPETRAPNSNGRIDVVASLLCVAGLGGLTAGIIALADRPPTATAVWAPLVAGTVALCGFLTYEHRAASPMLPLGLFRIRQFSAANAVTFLLYAANGGALLLLVIELQTVSGLSPLRAGSGLLPITIVMILLASRFGALAQHAGPRWFMAGGPLVSATGLALLTRLTPASSYWRDVLPALTVFALGLAIFVAPLTATALGTAPPDQAGIASGVNNAVARAAGLIAIAALPVLVGLTGDDYNSAGAYLGPFRTAMWICAALHLAAGVLAAATVRNPHHTTAGATCVPACSVALSGELVAQSAR